MEELFIEYLNRLNYEVDFAGDTNFTFDGLLEGKLCRRTCQEKEEWRLPENR